MIPILIICFNNYKYVDNTIKQLLSIDKKLIEHIIIVNNNSTCDYTNSFLKKLDCKVINNTTNNGPWLSPTNNTSIYDSLPQKYILTDPDLQFNPQLPSNFIDILSHLSDMHRCDRIGFALDIDDFDLMYPSIYHEGRTIKDWEQQFWCHKIPNSNYDLYYAPIDTTFALHNKKFINHTHIRIANNFKARHIPWYKDNPLYNTHDIYMSYENQKKHSTTTRLAKNHIDENFYKINKLNETFFIDKQNTSEEFFYFWMKYNEWENDAFKHINGGILKNKIFIDIGGTIGAVSLYASRFSDHVYSIESNKILYNDLLTNCKHNTNNVTCVNQTNINLLEIITKHNIDISLIGMININTDQCNIDEIKQFCSHHKILLSDKKYSVW